MNKSLNLGEVIELLKNIVDSVRCTVCDKAKGGRVRFPCGHAVCDGCLTPVDGCALCLTPPSTLVTPKVDEPFSLRSKNACSLLSACQDTFNIDVYRKLRLSEQLKAEKELFPNCIQAPVKYSNKRKSLVSSNNKENLGELFYPGEHISQSNSFTMNNRNKFVTQWLNNSEKRPRKAFSDLIVNQHSFKENVVPKPLGTSSMMKENANKNQHVNVAGSKNRKRSHSNSSHSLLDSGMKFKSTKIKKNNYEIFKDETNLKKNENDESGIVLDDEPILIEDSQSQTLDKDALALQAVQKADRRDQEVVMVSFKDDKSSDLLSDECNVNGMNDTTSENRSKKVQFMRKSSLADRYFDCKHQCDEIKHDPKNVSITIENNSFVATINISNVAPSGPTNKSVHIQTEISDVPGINKEDHLISDINLKESQNLSIILNNEHNSHKNRDDAKRELYSPNIFEPFENVSMKKSCVIDESESDESSVGDTLVHVTADVHKSCEPLDYGILAEIDRSRAINKSRRRARSATPDSNNSSDKENCDPNKRKKRKNSKKSKKYRL